MWREVEWEVLCHAQNPFQTTVGVWPDLGAQPHSEAPGGIWIKILQTQDYGFSRLSFKNDLKLDMGQPNSSK